MIGDDSRPMVGLDRCVVNLPEPTGNRFDPVDSFCQLLVAEAAELEAELGCPVVFADNRVPAGASGRCFVGPSLLNGPMRAWLWEVGGPAATEPVVRIDRERRVVAIDGPTIDSVGNAFQFLRTTVRRGDGERRRTMPDTVDAMLALIRAEVADTYPAFTLRELDWNGIMASHETDVRQSGGSLESLQRLFAGLQDSHTWVRDGAINARLPYRAWIEPDGAWFTHVPTWSAAWAAGVRAGDGIPGIDGRDWWERTAATPRSRAAVAGYRWLAGAVGSERAMRAVSASGEPIAWTERYEPAPWPEPISTSVLSSGTGYLRIRGWQFTPQWIDALDRGFAHVRQCPRLLVDLRGNVGGQLIAAQHFRDRFLVEPTVLGSVQFSIGGGRLGEPRPIVGSPPEATPLWHKPIRFLIDRQTYSASEDAILGLGGLPHVQIVGEPSGGGSGRPRTIALTNTIFATVSTALTFDRSGHCIEANGVPVDLPLPIDACFRHPVSNPASMILIKADQNW